MISFRQYLAGFFGGPVPFRITSKMDSAVNYRFNIKKELFNLHISKVGALHNHRYIVVLSLKGSVRNGSEFNLNGISNPAVVIATVKSILTSYFGKIPMNLGDVIEFETFDETTSIIYASISDWISKTYNFELILRSSLDRTLYILVKR